MPNTHTHTHIIAHFRNVNLIWKSHHRDPLTTGDKRLRVLDIVPEEPLMDLLWSHVQT